MGLGIRIKEILKTRGLTIKELSQISGVSINTLYSITKRDNNMARYHIVHKIATALNMSVEELTGQKIDYSKAENIKNARLHEILPQTEDETAPLDNMMNLINMFSGTDFPANNPSGNEYTEEELKKISEFAEFLKSQRDKNNSK